MSAANVQYDLFPEIIIRKEVRFNPELSWGEKAFISEIMSSKDRFYYQPKVLADRYQVTPVTIGSWVKKLSNAGLLEVATDYNDPICRHYIRRIEKVA